MGGIVNYDKSGIRYEEFERNGNLKIDLTYKEVVEYGISGKYEEQATIWGDKMKADRGIRILAQLLEVKTELQEQALSRTGASKRMCLAEIRGIDKALKIVKKEMGESD